MALDPSLLQVAFGMAPEDAVAFFEAKGYKITSDWHEMRDAAHAQAFTVANVAKLDILQDIRAALDKALKEGKTERWFIQDLKPLLQKKGWWGREERISSETGEIRDIQLGSPERLKTIYRTNLQSAYMAGRWRLIEEARVTHPYVQYVAVMDGRTRSSHAAMNGRVFKVDDPIWRTHAPPNGYNCRCRLRPMTEAALAREGIEWSSSEGMLNEMDWPISARDPSLGTSPVTVYKAPGMSKGFAPDVGFNSNTGMDWAKPFTPPPLDNLPRTFQDGVKLPDLLPPTPVSSSKLLKTGLPPEKYAKAFLADFGADVGKPVVFKDVAGDSLTVSEALFQDGAGRWKGDKYGRGPFMPLLADTIKSPDEIWLRWEESRDKPGTWLLKRRYLKAFELEGEDGKTFGIGAFEWGKDGWEGSTVFHTNANDEATRRIYLEQQRQGFLRYRRK